MGRYRSTPYEVEAWQYRCDADAADIMAACQDTVTLRCDDPPGGTYLMVKAPSADLRADKGDWILRGSKGDVFCVDPLTFKKQFEPADAATAIAHNQIVTPAQLPGADEHTLERLDGAEAQDYAGPPVVIAPYRRPADKRVKELISDAERERAALARGDLHAPPPRKTFSDPRLDPNYKPPKRSPPR